MRTNCPPLLEHLEERRLLSTYLTNLTFDAPVATMDQTLGVGVTAYAQQGVRAVTFWLDNNNDGRWTPGTDRTLGDVWTGSAATSATVGRRFTIDAVWSGTARVAADALDWSGRWSGTPMVRTIAVVNAPPAATLSALSSVVQPGETVVLTATAGAGTNIRAASFFVDMDGNGRWTPGTDLALGDVTAPAPGTNNLFRLATQAHASWGIGFQSPSQLGLETRSIGVNVVSMSGAWSNSAALTTITISPTPTVIALKVTGDASNISFSASTMSPSAGGWYAIIPPASNITQHVRFFHDANMNGRHDGGEAFLGTAYPTGTGQQFALNASMNSSAAWPRMFGAYTVDSAGRAGAVRSVMMYAATTAPGDIPAAVTQVRLAQTTKQFPNQPWWVEGEIIRVQTIAGVGSGGAIGIASVTVWYDDNTNGLPDPSEQVIALRYAGNAISFSTEVVTQVTGQGLRHIAAITQDARGRYGASMGNMLLVTRPPQLSNPVWTIESGPSGRFLRLDLTAQTESHLIRIDAVLDTGQLGRSYAPATGDSANGRYTLRINLAGVMGGAHSLSIVAVNTYAATGTMPLLVFV